MSKPSRYSKAAVAAKLAAQDELDPAPLNLPPPLPGWCPVVPCLPTAEQLADRVALEAEKLADRETLPPLSSVPMIKRVKFADHARAGGRSQPVRELESNQALLAQHELGVMIDGRVLVPWSNIRWIEYV